MNQPRPGGREGRFRKELQAVIRRARDRLGMSQEEFARALADQLGHPLSQSQISDWERGRFEPGASVVFAAAELANLSVDELRGSGPPALVERLERLEAELDQLPGARSGDRDEASDAGLVRRVRSVEREMERIGGLLADMISVLDDAGLWHQGGADSERATRRTSRGRTARSD